MIYCADWLFEHVRKYFQLASAGPRGASWWKCLQLIGSSQPAVGFRTGRMLAGTNQLAGRQLYRPVKARWAANIPEAAAPRDACQFEPTARRHRLNPRLSSRHLRCVALLTWACTKGQVEDAEREQRQRIYWLVLVRFKESAIKATLLSLLPPGVIVLVAAAWFQSGSQRLISMS